MTTAVEAGIEKLKTGPALLSDIRQTIEDLDASLGEAVIDGLASQVAGFLMLAQTCEFVVPSKEVDAVWHHMIEAGTAPALEHEAGYMSVQEEMEATMLAMSLHGLEVNTAYWSQPAYCGGGGGTDDIR